METGQRFEISSPTEDNPCTSSDPATESEEQEVSDDDDRNHKHRKREAEPRSVATDVDEQSIRRPNRKRKPFESKQMFLDNASNSVEGGGSSKFGRRHTVSTTASRFPSDLGSQTRVGQAFRPELGPRFIGSVAGRALAGRGRGRSTGFWNQQSSLDSLDFSSTLPPQGAPAHPGLFIGGFPSAASTQNASWGAYGFMHPIGMQGAVQPTISPLLNMAVPRQRCRDFEEQGFCLRGDMCPMEHGVNRIVVEDVQSLSQFNLPVSIPSSQVAGQAGSGSLPLGLPTVSKSLPLTDGQGTTYDTLMSDRVSSASGATEADVYDPDQPLWNNGCPEVANDHLQLSMANDDDDSLWSSGQGSLMLSDDLQTVQQKRVISKSIGTQGSNPSVWGRIRHGKKSDMARKTNSNVVASNQLENNTQEHDDDGKVNLGAATHRKHGSGKEMDPKTPAIYPLTKPASESGGDDSRTTKRASRTLYIYGIPQKSNRREALLSHFQKFGNIIDIYIPLNSEIAFVQFSKREEAEAALEAPDAVMGNRFIKLWWANRDRVHVEEEGGSNTKFSRSSGMLGSSVLSQLSSSGQITVPSASNTKMDPAGTSVPVTGPPKTLVTSAPTTPRPVQKKLDNLELLEEIRKKQELLDKKRDEFRRQLDNYAKQTISVKKVESSSEQASKKHKGDNIGAVAVRQKNVTNATENQAGESSQLRDSKENVLLSISNGNHGTLQNISTKDQSDENEPLVNSSELDCPPTSFIIVPPLPSGFTDIAVMRHHFSAFDDLDSVVFEDPALSDGKVAKPTIDSSVCVSFTTHDSAERAYTNGRCWEGQSLRFIWKAVSGGSSNNCHESEIVEPSQCLSSEIQAVPSAAFGNTVITSTRNGESSIDMEFTNSSTGNMPKVLTLASCSSPNLTPEDHTPISDASMG